MNPRVFSIIRLVAIGGVLALPLAHAKPANAFGTRDQPAFVTKEISDLVITPVLLGKLPVQPFKVGHVGEPGQPKREELLAAFSAFQTQYVIGADGKIIEATPWKTNGLVEISVTLRQEPASGFYMLGEDAAHCIILKAPDASDWTVGQKIRLLAYMTGTQEWTGAAGAVQKSPLYEALVLPLSAAQPNAPTREQFIAALRAGQSFTILIQAPAVHGEQRGLVVQKLSW